MNISTGYGLALASCGELCGRPCIARRDNGGQSLRAHHGEFTARRVCRVSRPRSSSSRESRIITRGRDRKLVCGVTATHEATFTHACAIINTRPNRCKESPIFATFGQKEEVMFFTKYEKLRERQGTSKTARQSAAASYKIV